MKHPDYSNRSLDDWLAWLETCHPTEIELGLERICLVADRLPLGRFAANINSFDNTSNTVISETVVSKTVVSEIRNSSPTKVITVAGTNGKGSCIATLESVLLAEGKSVGCYTSPHILRYNERIKLNGVEVSDEQICQAFEQVEAARQDISLTYFEFGTLAALLIFSKTSLDYCLLEIGLGGRLDAVNIVEPDMAVITSIAIDHEAWLGSDRETIASEKAGIIRRHKPVVCADIDPPNSLQRVMDSVEAKVFRLGREFSFETSQQLIVSLAAATTKKLSLPLPQLPLPSVVAALQVAQYFGEELNNDTLGSCFQNLSLAGRYEKRKLDSGLELIFDVAHNPASILHLAQKLHADLSHEEINKVDVVLAMMADKDILNALAPMKELVTHWHLCDLSHIDRAASAKELNNILEELNVGLSERSCYPSIAGALDLLQEKGAKKALVMGSFFTVAEAYQHIKALS